MINQDERAEKVVNAPAIINAVLAAVGMNPPKFAAAVGVSYQRIFDLKRGRTKKFNPGMVKAITDRFPQINKTFLFTGEGNVLNDDAPKPAESGAGVAAVDDRALKPLLEAMRAMQEKMETLANKERELLLKEIELVKREAQIEIKELKLNMNAK